MHAHFMMRGIKRDVDEIIKWLETRTFMLPIKDKDGKESVLPISSQLRYSIFGTWEYIFPESQKDIVLTTLRFHLPLHPNTFKMKSAMKMVQLAMGLENPPEFKTDMAMALPQEAFKNVHIIPIGVYYDQLDWHDELSNTYHERI